jgi:hypothetical protein
MQQSVRACVAYTVGRLISKRESMMLYDESQSKHLVIGGSVGARKIYIHDYGRGCFFSGKGKRSSYSLYDHGEASHLVLRIHGQKFEGYDQGSLCHFAGMVDGSKVSLFDYGANRFFEYRL